MPLVHASEHYPLDYPDTLLNISTKSKSDSDIYESYLKEII